MKVCAPSSSSSASKTLSLQRSAAPPPRQQAIARCRSGCCRRGGASLLLLAGQLAWSCYVAHTDKYSYDGGLENPQLQACMRLPRPSTPDRSRSMSSLSPCRFVELRVITNQCPYVSPSMHSWLVLVECS